MGEGGAGRVERAAVSVGGHDFMRAKRTTTVTLLLSGYAYDLSDTGYNPALPPGSLSLHESGEFFCAERVWACMTWRGMCGSGVGIGMGRMLVAVIPRGPSSGSYRVFRGGSWDYHAFDCRTAYRNGYPTDNYNYASGSAPSCPQVSELKRGKTNHES